MKQVRIWCLGLLMTGLAWGLAWGAPYDLANQGWEALNRGDHQKAVELFTQALDSGELTTMNRARSFNNRGLALLRLGKADQALADFDRALETAPKLVSAYYNRSLALAAQQKWSEALAAVERAISLDPQPAEFYFQRGNLRAAQNELEPALADFRAALERDPEFADALANQALILGRLGRPQEGLPLIEKARSHSRKPQYKEIQLWLQKAQQEMNP
jgi:tetratricopeptide (TPR) repeat protein